MKKWSYATALMLSLAGGGMLTGCIDNDEPYGIKEIRLATASLLESKKAAAEAEAAASAAQAEIEKIKAETEKIKAENAKIIAEAEAEIKKAQAANLQAEADRIKAETEAYIAKKKAALDEFIALAEIGVKEAELKYQDALYRFEKDKIDNANTANENLYEKVKDAFDAYLGKLKTLNNANYQYLEAQRKYAASLVDLEWVETSDGKGQFVSKNYNQKKGFEKNVAKAQAKVERAQANIDLNKQAIADLEASDLYTALQKYQTMQKENTEALANVAVEKEAVKIENAPLYEKQANLKKQIEEANTKPIAIAPYTYKPDANLSIPNFKDEVVIVDEKVTYTIDNSATYDDAVKAYDDAIAGMTYALLDENDKAWTQARVNEMTRELTAANGAYAADKAAWENAKAVYNNGQEVKASELPLEAEVEAAVAAYNAVGEKYAADVQKKNELGTAETNTKDAYNAAVKAELGENATPAYETYYQATLDADDAIAEAEKNYNDAVAKAASDKKIAYDKADADVVNAKNAEARAQAAFIAAQKELDLNPTDAALKTARDEAQAALNTAKDNNKAAPGKATTAKKNADAAYKTAVAKAETAKVNAENEAQKKLDDAYTTYAKSGQMSTAISTAYDAYKAAVKANEAFSVENPVAAAIEAAGNLEDAINNQLNKIGLDYWMVSPDCDAIIRWANGNNGNNGNNGYDEFPTAVAPVKETNEKGIYINAKYYLSETSEDTFGALLTKNPDNFGDYKDNDDIYPELSDEAMLIDNVTPEMVNAYIQKWNKDEKPYNYYNYYNNFGSYGQTLYLENRIAVAKIYLNNTDVINEATKALQANLDALKKTNKEAKDAVAKLEEEKDAVDEQIEELTIALKDKEDALGETETTLGKIIAAIEKGIVDTEFPDKQGSDLKAVLNEINNDIKLNEKRVAFWTEKLEAAQYQLDQYNNGYVDLQDPLEIKVEYFKAELDEAQIDVDNAKAHYEALQAKYDAATKQQ